MLRGSGVPRLRGIDQSQEFVDFKAFRSFAHQVLQLRGSFGIVARVIFGDGGLEVAVQVLALLRAGSPRCNGSQHSREN